MIVYNVETSSRFKVGIKKNFDFNISILNISIYSHWSCFILTIFLFWRYVFTRLIVFYIIVIQKLFKRRAWSRFWIILNRFQLNKCIKKNHGLISPASFLDFDLTKYIENNHDLIFCDFALFLTLISQNTWKIITSYFPFSKMLLCFWSLIFFFVYEINTQYYCFYIISFIFYSLKRFDCVLVGFWRYLNVP